MSKRAGLIILVGIAVGLLWQVKLKSMLTLRVGRFFVRYEITRRCKGNSQCEAKFAPLIAHLDECFTVETVTAIGKADEEMRKAARCMQKGALRDGCGGEARCVTSIDSFFDDCYSTAMRVAGPPSEPKAIKALLACINERAGAKILR